MICAISSCFSTTAKSGVGTPQARTIRFERPMLPGALADLTLRNLRLGDADADVRLRRSGTTVAVTVERREGDVSIDVVC